MNTAHAETTAPLAPWILTGVLPAEPQPSPAAPAEPLFNPLEGLDQPEA